MSCQACGTLGDYGQERLRDLSDVVDVRYGVGFGLGAEVQVATLETGLGYSSEAYQRQWFGRKSVEVRNGLFAAVLIWGVDGIYPPPTEPSKWGNSTSESFAILFKNMGMSPPWTGSEEWFGQPAGDVPKLDQLRIGGAVFLPGVNGGLYVNVAELADFLCGVFGYDMMHDDGIPKFTLPPDTPAGQMKE